MNNWDSHNRKKLQRSKAFPYMNRLEQELFRHSGGEAWRHMKNNSYVKDVSTGRLISESELYRKKKQVNDDFLARQPRRAGFVYEPVRRPWVPREEYLQRGWESKRVRDLDIFHKKEKFYKDYGDDIRNGLFRWRMRFAKRKKKKRLERVSENRAKALAKLAVAAKIADNRAKALAKQVTLSGLSRTEQNRLRALRIRASRGL